MIADQVGWAIAVRGQTDRQLELTKTVTAGIHRKAQVFVDHCVRQGRTPSCCSITDNYAAHGVRKSLQRPETHVGSFVPTGIPVDYAGRIAASQLVSACVCVRGRRKIFAMF
jgi:hypothetical protein